MYHNIRTLILRNSVEVVIPSQSLLQVDYGLSGFYREWRETMSGKMFNPALGSTSFVLSRLYAEKLSVYLFLDQGILKGIVVDYQGGDMNSYQLVSLFLETRGEHHTPMIGEYGNLYALFCSSARFLNFGGDVGRMGLRKFKERLSSKYLEVYHANGKGNG